MNESSVAEGFPEGAAHKNMCVSGNERDYLRVTHAVRSLLEKVIL